MQRANGRKNDELREVKFIKNYTKHALGSVLAQFGDRSFVRDDAVLYLLANDHV